MKRALAGVLAIAFVGLMAAGASAQVPFFQLFFDDNSNGSYGETQKTECGSPNSQQPLYLVLQNANAFVAAVDYQIAFPPALLFLNDQYPVVPGGSLNLGDSQAGNAISYGLPRNGFEPVLLVTINTLWTGVCDCGAGPSPLVVGGYQGKSTPNFIRWPDYAEFSGVGMTSLLCPGPVAASEATWGGIKALYR
jgi:hypothetical protein